MLNSVTTANKISSWEVENAARTPAWSPFHGGPERKNNRSNPLYNKPAR